MYWASLPIENLSVNKWIKYLSERRLKFFIRLKKNMIIEAFNTLFKVGRLFSEIKKAVSW